MTSEPGARLSTGQAARLCAVTPDTVLKWIKRGKLQATRTAGGHHRIALLDLEPFLPSFGRGRDVADVVPQGPDTASAAPENGTTEATPCWEYLAEAGAVPEGCRECIVYRARATRCFLMAGLDPDVGHARRFCQGSCEDCVYYRWLQGKQTSVLFITADEDLVGRVMGLDGPLELRFARNGYEASALVEEARPEVIVLDIEGHPNQGLGLLDSIAADPRLPRVRVIVVGPAGVRETMTLRPRHRLVAEILEKPRACERLAEAVRGSLAPPAEREGRTA